MAAGHYEPGSQEILLVGITGFVMYIAIGLTVLMSFRRGNRNEMTFYFFVCMVSMCILEVPRFAAMMVTREYTSKLGYVSHLLASSAFFAGFSCVCYQWKGLLKLGTYSTLIYSARGIVVSNAVFGCIEVVAIVSCTMAESLRSYFESISFELFTFVDAFKNVVFAGFLAYYGIRLISRFWRFRNADSKGSRTKSVFSVALHRLTVALSVATVCFAIRVTMLCLKMVVLHSSTAVTNDKFRFFGLFWFTLADFIPRGLPSLAFVALMMYSRRDTHSELNREFLRPGTELSNDALFIEYRNELDDSSNGPPAHFKFLSDGYSPRTAGHDYYDELSYDEEDNDMLLLDGIHLDALGYRSPISSYPTRGRLLSHTEV